MDLATRGLIHLLHYWIPSMREPVPFARNTRSVVLQMNGEKMKRLIVDDEDRVLLLRFPRGWGLWVDLGGALLDEAFRSDLVFFESIKSSSRRGKAGLNTPSLDLAVAQLWGRIIRPLLGADYPPPGIIPP